MVDPPSQSPRVAVAPAAPRAKSVVLNDPAPPPATVTGIPLWVRGQAAPAVRQVVIVLSDGEVQIGFQVVEPTRAGSFSAVFTLRPPRPEMELTVVVVGRDSRAQPVGSAGRPVLISALEAAPDATPRASLGEDGVLGSRGVAVLRPPEAPRASPRR